MTKVSVVTVCYNSQETIEDTIKSVIQQDYPNIEYIIVDGLSKDNTLSIVQKYKDKIAKVVSEKDKGIYDAINKGIELCTGNIVSVLNSDDMYASTTVISQVVAQINRDKTQAAYGDLNYVNRYDTQKIVRKWKSGNYKHGKFFKGWMPPHPTFFIEKSCYQKFGKFNLELKTSADYELMLRMIHVHRIKISYVPHLLVNMRTGGQSNVSLLNRIKGNKEDYKAWHINGLKPKFFTLYLKPLSKIFQYL
jgi:glycosyltransferase involved in cell wall biosynthesis